MAMAASVLMAEDVRQWGKVAAAVRAQRTALGLKQTQLAKRADVDPKTISKMEAGFGPFRDLTLSAVSRVLWDDPDVLSSVAGGARPPRRTQTVRSVDPEDDVQRWDGIDDEAKQTIIQVIRLARRRRPAV